MCFQKCSTQWIPVTIIDRNQPCSIEFLMGSRRMQNLSFLGFLVISLVFVGLIGSLAGAGTEKPEPCRALWWNRWISKETSSHCGKSCS